MHRYIFYSSSLPLPLPFPHPIYSPSPYSLQASFPFFSFSLRFPFPFSCRYTVSTVYPFLSLLFSSLCPFYPSHSFSTSLHFHLTFPIPFTCSLFSYPLPTFLLSSSFLLHLPCSSSSLSRFPFPFLFSPPYLS